MNNIPGMDYFAWTLRGGRRYAPHPPYGVMGIVNFTPDSFYDGGRRRDAAEAAAHALRLMREGADIIDLGVESSRPGAMLLPVEEEIGRLAPLLAELRKEMTRAKDGVAKAIISIDSWKKETAAYALESGAHIINDISACRFDPGLMDVLGQYKPGYVLMHAQGRPENMQNSPKYINIIDELIDFFSERMHAVTRAGLPEENIVLDPGIGFGKTIEHNLAIISEAGRLKSLGRPLLAGISMKSFLRGIIAGNPHNRESADNASSSEERMIRATQTATTVLALKGFALHRVHHARPAIDALRLAQAFINQADGGKIIS